MKQTVAEWVLEVPIKSCEILAAAEFLGARIALGEATAVTRRLEAFPAPSSEDLTEQVRETTVKAWV
jgi:hypothetical protein